MKSAITIGRSKESYAYRMILPSIVVLVLVLVVPLFLSAYMSFHSWSLLGQQEREFVGLANYIEVFTSTRILDSLRITLIFVVASVSIEFLLGLGIALILNRPFRGYKAVRVVMLFPMLISPAIIALVWRLILHPTRGILNYILVSLGFQAQVWFDRELALVVLVAIEIWMQTPFIVLMILAGLQSIPQDLMDAAAVDGTNGFQRLTRVILPIIQPVIMVALVFRTMFALRNFPLPWVLTGGGPAGATNVFGIELYRQAFSYYHLGMAGAMSWVLVLITAVMSIMYIRFTYREALS